ncbi:MAG: xanthine dehydrogenase family protein molybdopterin-binding subunit [Alphaproteobacteria bacterium]
MEKYGIGQPVRRKEDVRLITGNSHFTDDLNAEGQLHAYFLRSPHAHARIIAIDTTGAKAAPGVVDIFTSTDTEADGLGTLPCLVDLTELDGTPLFKPSRSVLATGTVRLVGEAVAMVVANSLNQAMDAAEKIEVDYQVLPAVVSSVRALEADAPLLWPERGSNVCLHWQNRDRGDVDTIFDGAHKVVAVDLVNNRVVPSPMEPRCALADYDALSGKSTLYAPTQGGHRIQRTMSKAILKIPDGDLRIVSYATGGGFGVRSKLYPELVLTVWASRKLARPVKWRGDRSETFISDIHGRDQINHAELALDADGKALALRIETFLNVGAYLSENGPRIPITAGGRIVGGAYDIPALYFSVHVMFTNTTPTDTYRGAGRPEANYIMERLMEKAAIEMAIDGLEIRRRNFIANHAFPYTTQMGMVVDCGDFAATMDQALDIADWNGFAARRFEAAGQGRLRGIGLGYYLEAAGGRISEEMRVKFEPDGTVTIVAGTFSHGQGHHTVFSQIISETLGVEFDDVNLVQGDTDIIPDGAVGTFGSRTSQMGGVGLVRACAKIIDKGKVIAGHLLQTDAAGVRFQDGEFLSGDSSVSLADVAQAAFDPQRLPDGMDPGLDESYHYERGKDENNYPNGCHICEVEVDPDTGNLEIVAFAAVDDCGKILNPMIVHGQVHGGIAQGVGQALCEHTVYDEVTGQLLTGSYMDYAMPRADQFPPMVVDFNVVPSPLNDLGVKGAGEAGCCGAPSALVLAVLDALKDLGIRHIDMPLTPERVWRTIQDARAAG